MMMGVHESAWDVLPESINPSKRRRLRATVARKDTLSHWQTPLSATLVSLGSKHRFPTWCSAISVFQGHFQGVAAQQNALCVLAGHHKPKKGRCMLALYPGTHSLNQGGVSCTLCDPNKYMPHINSNSTCETCPLGYFTSKRGSIACIRVPPGSFLNERKSIEFCKPGFMCPGAENTSTPCPAGKFANEVGSRVCQKCIPGQYSPMTAATSCELCPDGWLQTQDGASNCLRPSNGTIAVGGTSFVPISEGWKGANCDEKGICITTVPCPAGTRGWRDDSGSLGTGCLTALLMVGPWRRYAMLCV